MSQKYQLNANGPEREPWQDMLSDEQRKLLNAACGDLSAQIKRATMIRASGKRKAKPANTVQRRRWDVMRTLGCIACKQRLYPWGATGMEVEMHHLLSGGRRIGHDATIALCHWHHQAKRFPSTTSGYSDQAKLYGPSLEREPRRFHEMYGSDAELLALQNELIKGAK